MAPQMRVAAQYVPMSTDNQDLSISIQKAAIAEYAAAITSARTLQTVAAHT
jgi:hypothetical protein